MSRRWKNEAFDGHRQIDANEVDAELGVTRRRVERLQSAIEHRQPDLHLVIENVHDPHNVSAVLRTCDAVGVGVVHLVYSDGEFPRLGKASSASAWKWMEIERHSSIEVCYDSLRARHVRILATDLTDSAVSLYEADLASPAAIVFGNEHRGLTRDASEGADGNLVIPMVGLIQSLNISVACAVTLYEAMRQRLERGYYRAPRMTEEGVREKLRDWTRR